MIEQKKVTFGAQILQIEIQHDNPTFSLESKLPPSSFCNKMYCRYPDLHPRNYLPQNLILSRRKSLRRVTEELNPVPNPKAGPPSPVPQDPTSTDELKMEEETPNSLHGRVSKPQ